MKRTSTSCPSYWAEDEVILGDAGYASDEYKRGSRRLGIRWYVQDKRKPGQNLSGSQKKRNRKHSSIRAWVEHVSRVIKRQFGLTKTRYRGLMKNSVQVNMLMSLGYTLSMVTYVKYQQTLAINKKLAAFFRFNMSFLRKY